MSVVVAGLDNHNPVADVVSLLYRCADRGGARPVIQAFISWWCASILAVLAIVLSVSIATLDKLGFK